MAINKSALNVILDASTYTYVGLARTIYTRCTGIRFFGREITKYTVMYGAYIRFCPTLHKAYNDQRRVNIYSHAECTGGCAPSYTQNYRCSNPCFTREIVPITTLPCVSLSLSLSHTHTHTHTHTTHTHAHTHVHTHTLTLAHMHTWTYTYTHTHTCTHAHIYTHMHTCTQAHTHTPTAVSSPHALPPESTAPDSRCSSSKPSASARVRVLSVAFWCVCVCVCVRESVSLLQRGWSF